MTITKNVLNLMIFFLTYKRSLAQSANSQQPTANSQQPTANSQQPTSVLNKKIFNIIIIYLMKQSGFGFFPVALFLCLFGSSTTLTDRK